MEVEKNTMFVYSMDGMKKRKVFFVGDIVKKTSLFSCNDINECESYENFIRK